MMRAMVAMVVLAACGGARNKPYVPPPQPVTISTDRGAGPLVPASSLEGEVKRIHIGGANDGLRLRISAELQPLMGAKLEAGKLREALVRVMKVRGVADVVARGEQLGDGVGLILDVTQEPVLRNITAVESGGKRIALGKDGVGLGIGSLLDPMKVQAAAEAVRERYVEKGHLEATAKWRKVPSQDGVDIVIEVDPGTPSTVDSISFVGNASIPGSALLAELRGSPAVGQPVVTEAVERATLLISAYYWDHGHANVRVTAPRLGPGRVALEFAIDEGPVFRLGAIALKGDVDPNDQAMLLTTLGVNTGDLFSRTAIVDGRTRVESALAARGGKFEILPLTKVDLATRTIDLTFEVTRK